MTGGKYHTFRARPLVLAAMGLLLCIVIGAAGGLAKSMAAWSAKEKRPIYSVETDKKLVSLGINCAWGDEDIPAVLAALDECGVKATFFIVGEFCGKYPGAVKMISDAGHEIGSHSDTHADMTKLDDAGILREIRDSAKRLQAVTGAPVKLFRVPSGAYNSHVIDMIEREGMYPIQWDCDSLDYKDLSAETMRDRILKNVKNGSIMLFHSGTKNTASALPVVINAVKDKGFDFVMVSELILPPPYSVDIEGRQIKAKTAG